MSERETFLARWSRRKLEIEEQQRAADPPAQEADDKPTDETKAADESGGSPAEGTAPEDAAAEKPEFDFLSHLPSIESITATTDIRPFLTPGVPAELTRAALRRAWSVDPSIRDYIGLAENQWDFASGDLHGFGPLELTEDLRKIVAEIVGGARSETGEPAPAKLDEPAPAETQPQDAVAESAPLPGPGAQPTATASHDLRSRGAAVVTPAENIVQHSKDGVALREEKPVAGEVKLTQRGHGSALPR